MPNASASFRGDPNMETASSFVMGHDRKRAYLQLSTMLTVYTGTLSCKIAYMELKDRIRAARESAGLTQDHLAKRVGVSRPAVGMWEGGQTKTIEGENLVRTAYATGVDPLWLATGEGHMHTALMAKEDLGVVPKKFADAWRQIDNKNREHLMAIAEALANQSGRYR